MCFASWAAPVLVATVACFPVFASSLQGQWPCESRYVLLELFNSKWVFWGLSCLFNNSGKYIGVGIAVFGRFSITRWSLDIVTSLEWHFSCLDEVLSAGLVGELRLSQAAFLGHWLSEFTFKKIQNFLYAPRQKWIGNCDEQSSSREYEDEACGKYGPLPRAQNKRFCGKCQV